MNPTKRLSPWRAANHVLLAVLLAGCYPAGIQDTTPLAVREPYRGPVEATVREGFVARVSPVVEMVVKTNFGHPRNYHCTDFGGTMAKGELLEEVKSEAARHGANVVVFDCPPPGAIGACICRARGYYQTASGRSAGESAGRVTPADGRDHGRRAEE